MLGLKVTNDNKLGFKVSLAGIVNIGASGERLSSTGNTLTVSFGQTGLEKLADAISARDKECKKHPKGPSCAVATATAAGGLSHIGVLSATRPDIMRKLLGIDR